MDLEEIKKKYKHMEKVIQYVSKNYISLDEDECKKNSALINKV